MFCKFNTFLFNTPSSYQCLFRYLFNQLHLYLSYPNIKVFGMGGCFIDFVSEMSLSEVNWSIIYTDQAKYLSRLGYLRGLLIYNLQARSSYLLWYKQLFLCVVIGIHFDFAVFNYWYIQVMYLANAVCVYWYIFICTSIWEICISFQPQLWLALFPNTLLEIVAKAPRYHP